MVPIQFRAEGLEVVDVLGEMTLFLHVNGFASDATLWPSTVEEQPAREALISVNECTNLST